MKICVHQYLITYFVIHRQNTSIKQEKTFKKIPKKLYIENFNLNQPIRITSRYNL